MAELTGLKMCAHCGKPIQNGRFKYCSEQCNVEAHRIKCRENFRKRYVLKHEQELERCKVYYETHTEQKKAAVRRRYFERKAKKGDSK